MAEIIWPVPSQRTWRLESCTVSPKIHGVLGVPNLYNHDLKAVTPMDLQFLLHGGVRWPHPRGTGIHDSETENAIRRF